MKRSLIAAVLPVSFAAVTLPIGLVLAAPPAAAKSVPPAERLAVALKDPALVELPLSKMNSVRKLSAYVRARRAVDAVYDEAVADAKKHGKPAPKRPLRDTAHKTDWYEAYLQEYRERAYPNDSIDPLDIIRAEDERDRMRISRGATRAVSDVQSATFGRLSRTDIVGVAPPPSDIVTGNWQFVGPKNLGVRQNTFYGPAGSNISGRINGLAFHPTNSSILYAAVGNGGVWRTTDGGVSWTSTADSALTRQEATSVAVHPTNPNIVLAGLGDAHGYSAQGTGRGILRSIDGGNSWNLVTLTTPYIPMEGVNAVGDAVSAIVFDPDTPDIVLATSSTYAGFRWRSTNAGASWTRLTDPAGGNSYSWWSSLSVGQPDGSGRRFYYATSVLSSAGTTTGLWRSADKGVTWAQVAIPPGTINQNLGFEAVASSVDPNIVYFIRGSDQAIYRGIRNQASDLYDWIEIGGTSGAAGGFKDSQNWGQLFYNFYLNCGRQIVNGVAKDALYVSLLSVNGGLGTNELGYVPNWVDIGKAYVNGSRTHSDNHSTAIFPGDTTKMAVGNDGGFYPMTYNPALSASPTEDTWTFTYGRNAGIYITQFYQADFHPDSTKWMLGGLQDNAQPASVGDLDNWINLGGGDGSGAAIDAGNPLRQYSMNNYLQIRTTTNGWQSDFGLTPPFNSLDRRPLIGYMGSDPNYPNAAYVGSNYLWRYSPLRGAWEARLGNVNMTGDGGGQVNDVSGIRVIAVAPSTGKTIYTGTPNGKLWASFNDGTTWTALSNSGTRLPNRAITGIDVSPTNDKDILVTLSGFASDGHVFRCANTASATPVFTKVDGSGAGTTLPNIPFDCIARDYNDPANTWYAGSDIGVFQTVNAGATWTNATASLGMPNISVRSLKAVRGTGYLMAATHGRGIWRIALQNPLPVASVKAQFQTPVGTVNQSMNYGSGQYGFDVLFTFANLGGTSATEVTVTSVSARINGVNCNATTGTGFVPPTVYGTVAEGAGSISRTFRIRSAALVSGTSYPSILTVKGTYKENGVVKGFQSSSRVTFRP